ncbi:DUF580-domain-containing protein [Zalerion maritima]|uniref:Protein PNS1 n=1 Tax=Zalerion maritima TaxID=339359 RepID=A0AAD5RPW3_9PEZI|nr:DUF580-domain-containing protein [Zalerion maritima]
MGENDSYYRPGGGVQPQQQGYQPGQPMNANYQPPPQPQPQYQHQQNGGAPPPYSYTPQVPPQGEKYTFDQAFKVEGGPKYHDIWAGVLFILVVIGFGVVSGLSLYTYSNHKSAYGNGIDDGVVSAGLSTNALILYCIVLGVAFVFSYLYIELARRFTKQFIWITGILNIIWCFVTAFYMLAKKAYGGGIVFLIFGVFIAFCFWSWRRKIPFSALMLKTSVDVSKKYGHVYLVSLIGGIVGVGLAIWWAATIIGIYAAWDPNSGSECGVGGCSQAKVNGLIAFSVFAVFWISEWLKNTIHTIVSGVYGSWYFCKNNFPKNATRGAAKRALTYSFGSISLGSLIVAIIQFLRQIAATAAQQEGAGGDIVGYVCFCVASCILGILEWAVEFLNRYAFSHIALYGKSYIAAAKDTWKLIKDRGIDALINECLIGPVLGFGATFIGYACALLAFIYLLITDPSYNSDGTYTAFIVAFAFLIGFQIANIFTTPLSSGVDTIFVAMAWDPEVMIREHPDLYHEMVKVYPHVQQAIHA